MRKMLTIAVYATATLALATGVAVGQSEEIRFTPVVSPADAGTVNKPKNSKLRFQLSLTKPGTTVKYIDISLPKSLKLSGKGLGSCTVDDLSFEGPAACASSKAGPQGTATAQLGDGVLKFTIQPFVKDARTMLFYVASEAGAGVFVQSPITGKITNKGRKLRIEIPEELRRPGGVDASLTSIDQTFTAKKGRRYLVSSVGCRNRKHTITGKLSFTDRLDHAPVPGPVSTTASSRCTK